MLPSQAELAAKHFPCIVKSAIHSPMNLGPDEVHVPLFLIKLMIRSAKSLTVRFTRDRPAESLDLFLTLAREAGTHASLSDDCFKVSLFHNVLVAIRAD